jgi:hypothetical protein
MINCTAAWLAPITMQWELIFIFAVSLRAYEIIYVKRRVAF